ncbi:hypothetical protein ACNKF0_09480 [Nocardioides sp. T5]|uniref:hypothetical protein n=1 Tax=Nocardioides sp. T5 TaxID=3400182 RepID=UPI003A894B86
MTKPLYSPSTIPPRLVIPTPRPPGGGFARKNPAPPTLTDHRDADALYILDSGVGLSFAHVDQLDLLAQHYAGQLEYVHDVVIEWQNQSRLPDIHLREGDPAEKKTARDNVIALKAAAAKCLKEVPVLFGPHVDLGNDELENVQNLITELCALHPERENTGGDRGESSSVRLGELRRTGQRVIVLCSNDDRGRRLAHNHSIACRNVGTVLIEMVREERLTAEEAFDHYQTMLNLSGVNKDFVLESVDDFR